MGSALGPLAEAVHCGVSLLYPLEWQQIFVPLLPRPVRPAR